MEKTLISIIVPVYMNEGSLLKLHSQLSEVISKINKKYSAEMVFVNDGSTDNSLKILMDLRKKDKRIKIIDFPRNFGQSAAIYAGFENTESNLAIVTSADLQDPPQLILKMIEKWEKGFKVVICERTSREDRWPARLTSFIFYSFIKKFVPNMPRGGYDYFLLDKMVYKKLFYLNEKNSFLQSDILWFGYKTFFIQYCRNKRSIGISQWTLGKKFKLLIDGFISVTYFPIRLISSIGLIIAIFGFLYSFVVLYAWFFKKTPFTGYAPIMMVLLTVSGLIIIMLGIIGEYQWRIYDEIKKKPRYIVQKKYF